jgi:hypothetical protein
MAKNSSEYVVSEALLDADRKFKSSPYGQPIDIYGMIAEVSIFESLEKSYLTAQIVIVDSQAVMSDIVNLQGTEKLKITIKTINEGEGAENEEFTLNLRVSSVADETKTNDYTMVYVLNCVSEHAFNDANAQISKSYTGQVEDIAERVLKDYLDVKVHRDEKYWEGETVQGRLKVIVPYLSPIDTASWMVERGCKSNSSPIFMWKTIWDEEDDVQVRLGDLSTMCSKGSAEVIQDLGKPAAEWKRSFVYTAGAPNNTDVTPESIKESSAKENRTIISEMGGTTTNSDTLKMINEGVLGSRMASFDAYTTQKFDRHFDLKKFMEYYRSSVATPGKEIFPDCFDEDHNVRVGKETKNPVEFDSRGRNLITSYGTYEWENSYHDVPDQTAAMNKVRKNIIKGLMYRDLTTVTIPGYSFMIRKLAAGDCIGIAIKENFTDDEGANAKSEEHTGIFLILSLRHVFISNTHNVVATCCKVEDVKG